MAFTYKTITHTFETPDDLAATGVVEFRPVRPMHNGITVVSKTVVATLSGTGQISKTLAANTDPDTWPTGTTYEVTEKITGQAPVVYFIQVPHTGGDTIDLRTLAGWVGGTGGGGGSGTVSSINGESPDGSGNVVVSAADVGAQPADADLTGLAGLGDGYPRRASSTWTARSAGQFAADLGAVVRVLYTGGAYPARPTGLPAGYAEYVGPTQPATWLDGDTWIEVTA